MPVVRKPLKKLSSQSTQAGVYTPPALAPVQVQVLRVVPSPTAESNEIGNQSRIAAGAGAGQNGFTCIRCLQWFPAGTSHACRPYADVIRNVETPDVKRGPMSADEVLLLQQDGQL